MRKWVAGLLLSISVILLTISLYFLMGFFMQERQDNQLQQELQELMQEKEDDPEEDTSDDLEVDAIKGTNRCKCSKYKKTSRKIC